MKEHNGVGSNANQERAANPKNGKGKVSLKELMAIAKQASRAVKRPYVEHGKLLYDEQGLPR